MSVNIVEREFNREVPGTFGHGRRDLSAQGLTWLLDRNNNVLFDGSGHVLNWFISGDGHVDLIVHNRFAKLESELQVEVLDSALRDLFADCVTLHVTCKGDAKSGIPVEKIEKHLSKRLQGK